MTRNSNSQPTGSCRSRREFLGAAAAGAAFSIVPSHVLGGPGKLPPSEKLNLAMIGVGGQGFRNAVNMAGQNIVALCDVDTKRGAEGFERFPGARRYRDYRRMLEVEEQQIDAVVVSCPDHGHIPASVMAMRMGKHVYCEKPLGHNIHEVRLATKVARETGVVTQMGNGAHSSYNYRAVAKMIRDGVIGEVREVHCWCDNEWDDPPRVPAGDGSRRRRGRPEETPAVPEHLDWDLWLGPAPSRPYHPCYHPIQWRSWYEFGNGRLGDMGCHLLDLPFTALDLKSPLTVEADAPQAHPESAPPWLICKWTFAARGDLPPVELTWHDGNKRPGLLKKLEPPRSAYPWYVLLVGAEGMLIAGMDTFRLYPEEKYKGVRRPKLPPGRPHHENWLEACRIGNPAEAGCHFDYSGPLTETVLLGTVAYQAGQKLEWDAKNLKIPSHPEAERFLKRRYREGWTI